MSNLNPHTGHGADQLKGLDFGLPTSTTLRNQMDHLCATVSSSVPSLNIQINLERNGRSYPGPHLLFQYLSVFNPNRKPILHREGKLSTLLSTGILLSSMDFPRQSTYPESRYLLQPSIRHSYFIKFKSSNICRSLQVYEYGIWNNNELETFAMSGMSMNDMCLVFKLFQPVYQYRTPSHNKPRLHLFLLLLLRLLAASGTDLSVDLAGFF